MAVIPRQSAQQKLPPLRWVRGAAGRRMLDEQARRLLGISGDEFLRRWEAGEYADRYDDLESPEIRRLARLIRFAR